MINGMEMIFNLITEKKYDQLEDYIYSNHNTHLLVDNKNRSPLFLAFVEHDYQALLILLKKQEFMELLNSPLKMDKYGGAFEFQVGFGKYYEPLMLIPCLPFIKNMNAQDNNGDTCFHYFCYQLEHVAFSKSLLSHTSHSQEEKINQEVITTLESFINYGLDLSIKNKKGQMAIDYIEKGYLDFFKPTVDFINSYSEKSYLEKQVNEIQSHKKQKL